MRRKILLLAMATLLSGISLSGCFGRNPGIVESSKIIGQDSLHNPCGSIASNNGSDSLISNDFFIFVDSTRIIPNNFPLRFSYSETGGQHIRFDLSEISGDLIQIGVLIRDNGFKDYTVKFTYEFFNDIEIAEVEGKDTINTGEKNAIAFAEWRIPESVSVYGQLIKFTGLTLVKVRVIPQGKISQDPNLANNELNIFFNTADKADDGFYFGIPANGDKKIALVVFQEREFGLLQKLIQKVFPKNYPSPLKELLNPEGFTKNKESGKLIPSVFYLKQFLSEESQKYTGKNLFSDIKMDIIGPYEQKMPPDVEPIPYLREQTLSRGVNLEGYDIIAYIYLADSVRHWRSYAERNSRELYAEFLNSQVPQTSVLFHEIMHLFGASDHYSGYAKMSNPPDIMADSSIMEINQFTAQEIGWADRNHNGIVDAEEPNLYQIRSSSD